MPKRQRPWGRIVMGILAALMLLIGPVNIQKSSDLRHRADEARVAEVLRLDADLSKPGEYSGRFTLNMPEAHGSYVEIRTDLPCSSYEDVQRILHGLSGRVTMTNLANGWTRDEGVGPDSYAWTWVGDAHAAPAIQFFFAPVGTYEMKFVVTSGAPHLARVPQTLVVRYEICGMEYLVANVAWLIGMVCSTIAGILISAIVIVTVTKRRRQRDEEPTVVVAQGEKR